MERCYRAVFQNALGQTISAAAILTVHFAPVITTQPANQTGLVDQTVQFTVQFNANPAATVQWQASANGSDTFVNIADATEATLRLTASATATAAAIEPCSRTVSARPPAGRPP